jgi:hypothetical protein
VVKDFITLGSGNPAASYLNICMQITANGTPHIRHQCRKTAVLRCHRFQIYSGVEKNIKHLNID